MTTIIEVSTITVEVHVTKQTALAVCNAAPFKGLDVDVTTKGLILKMTPLDTTHKASTRCRPLTINELTRLFQVVGLLGG